MHIFTHFWVNEEFTQILSKSKQQFTQHWVNDKIYSTYK
jgi:hypothetical protein